MPVNFEHHSSLSGFFYDCGKLKIGDELELENVCSYTHCVGLLKLFGLIEDISISGSNRVIHASKSTLIRQFREHYHPQGLSDNNILRIIRSATHQNNKIDNDISQTEKPTSQIHSSAHMGEYIKQDKETFNRIQMGPLAGMGIRGGVVSESEDRHPRALRLVNDLASFMKFSLPPPKELHQAIQEQFEIVRVIDADGVWIDKQLAEISDHLLPGEQNIHQKCEELIDAIANAVKNNPYFLSAIDNIDEQQLDTFRRKVMEDNSRKMLQYLVPYAMAFNGLTAAFSKDVQLFDKIDKMWSKIKEPHNVRQYMKLFAMIKYYTLGDLSHLKEPIRTKSIDKYANRHYVNLNIFEAVVADMVLGNKNNAYTGLTLMYHPAGNDENPFTGAGSTTVEQSSKGYDVIKLRPDLPKEWADLYTVWNFAFCSNAKNFPLIALKLLIPSVNDYASDPEAYIYHRGIALYLYFQFSIMQGISNKEPDFLDGWDLQDITDVLGEANYQSAQDYEERVRKAKEAKNPQNPLS